MTDEAAPLPGRGFLEDCRIETSAFITHLPTGLLARGTTVEEATADLAHELVRRGDISINDARAALGLPEMRLDGEG